MDYIGQGWTASITCIAGASSGAWLGVEAIPQEWRERIEQIERSDYFAELALRLAEASDRLDSA